MGEGREPWREGLSKLTDQWHQEPIARRSIKLPIVSIEQRFRQVHLESLSDISLFGKHKIRRRYSL